MELHETFLPFSFLQSIFFDEQKKKRLLPFQAENRILISRQLLFLPSLDFPFNKYYRKWGHMNDIIQNDEPFCWKRSHVSFMNSSKSARNAMFTHNSPLRQRFKFIIWQRTCRCISCLVEMKIQRPHHIDVLIKCYRFFVGILWVSNYCSIYDVSYVPKCASEQAYTHYTHTVTVNQD